MANKDAKKGKSWKHCRGIRKRQINVRKSIEARLARRGKNGNGNEGELDIEVPGVVQEPEGGIIFEAPNLVQEPGDEFSGVQDLVQEPENGFIAPEGARGMPQVSSTKPGGVI